MSIIVDRDLREQIRHEEAVFPIAFFEGELRDLPDRTGPLHWHPDFEVARAETAAVEYQVGQARVLLQPGDSIFVNINVLHSVRQPGGGAPDPLPVAVFSGSLIAPEASAIYRNYIAPIAGCLSLPFVVFRRQDPACAAVRAPVDALFASLRRRPPCYEMAVQRSASELFESLFRGLETWPRAQATRVQLRTQVRVQQMLACIYARYAEPLTLDEIARAASVSRTEAARCFHEYMGCPPMRALLNYRLRVARRLLRETPMSVQQVSTACGFSRPGYFARQFRRLYGCAPGEMRRLGK